jgi:hypothetical protein
MRRRRSRQNQGPAELDFPSPSPHTERGFRAQVSLFLALCEQRTRLARSRRFDGVRATPALPPVATGKRAVRHFSFVPWRLSDAGQTLVAPSIIASVRNPAQKATSVHPLDHLVGAGEQRERDGEAERLGTVRPSPETS